MNTIIELLLKALLGYKEAKVKHVIDGEVYTEEVRNGFVYIKDSRGFVKPLRDARGFYVRK